MVVSVRAWLLLSAPFLLSRLAGALAADEPATGDATTTLEQLVFVKHELGRLPPAHDAAGRRQHLGAALSDAAVALMIAICRPRRCKG